MEMRRSAKKRNFSEVEIDCLTVQVEKHKNVLFGSIKAGIKGAHKNAAWKIITDVVNSVAVQERTPAEVRTKLQPSNESYSSTTSTFMLN